MDYYKNQTYYDVLGLPKYGKKENGEEVTLDSIRRAKDRLKFGNSDDRVPFSMWNKIDEAYSVLSDIEKRKEYDRNLEETKNDILSIESFSSLQSKENQVKDVQNDIIDDRPSIMETKEKPVDSKEFYKNDQMDLEDRKETIYPNFQLIMEKSINILENNSIVPKLKKVGKEAILALPTSVLATIKIIKEINNSNKYKLNKEVTEKNISQVKTLESELEEEYRKKLDEKIDKVLDEHHYNYNLEIDKLRYENYIELLNKKIQQKENQVVKKGGLTIYKLQLTALKKQLDAFKLSLDRVNEKLNKKQKKQKLSKIHEKLIEVNEEIKENDKKIITIKKLKIRQANLLNKKKLKISRIKTNREYYSIIKDSFTSARNVTENFIHNAFVPADKVDYVTQTR